jgi:hypothetical protein
MECRASHEIDPEPSIRIQRSDERTDFPISSLRFHPTSRPALQPSSRHDDGPKVPPDAPRSVPQERLLAILSASGENGTFGAAATGVAQQHCARNVRVV